MSRSLIVIWSIIGLFATSCGANKEKQLEDLKKFPAYEEVATEFFENYGVMDRNFISFAKKPDGWYLVVTSYSETGEMSTHDFHFWSLQDESYKKLEAPDYISDKPSPDGLDYFLMVNSNPAWYANRFPYYGYPGYEDATINLLEGIEDLNDTLQHALANAYFGKAQWVIGLRNSEGPGYMELKPEVTDDSLDHYMDYAIKCLDAYKKLVDRNPTYETWVGNIQTKISNDAVALYSEMDWRGRGAEVRQLLEYVNYPASLADFAHNILAGCDSNAILFTNGDNDTYPLWYEQYQGFRKDVAVVNLSLINVPFYIDVFKNYNDLELTLPGDVIRNSDAQVVMVDPQSTRSNDLRTLMQEYATNFNIKNKPENVIPYFVIPGYVTIPFNAVKDQIPAEVLDKMILEMPLEFTFGGSYLYLADWVVLNLMLENAWKRPVYFASSVSLQSQSEYVSPYALNEGLVFRINPYKTQYTGLYQGVNTEKMMDNLEHRYRFSEMNEKEGMEEPRILANVFNIYQTLASTLIQQGDKTGGKKYLDEGVKKFPMSLIKDPSFYLYTIHLYLQLEEKEIVKELVNTVCEQVNKVGLERGDDSAFLSVADELELSGMEKESMLFRDLVQKYSQEKEPNAAPGFSY